MNAKKKPGLPEGGAPVPSENVASSGKRKVSASVAKGVADAVERLTGGSAPIGRTSSISTILENALAAGSSGKLADALGSSIRGLLAFHDRYLSDDTDPETLNPELKDIYGALASSFAKNLLDEMHADERKHYLTAGSEGEIYRLSTDSGEFIIAKRRYDSRSGSVGTDRECDLQKEARRIAKGCDGIAVPKIFSRIPDPEGGCEYVVMEYVRGKTLWTLALETLANEGGPAQPALALETHPILRFFEERSHFSVRYDNDTEAENDMVERYRTFGEKIGSPYDLGSRVVDPVSRQITYPYLKPHLDADLARTQVFGPEVIQHISSKLRPFLAKLHDQGIYHRDLNVRNLMIGEDGLIYVIDFGKGIRSTPNDDSVYDAQEGKHDNDFSILELIRSYGPKAETEADKIRRAAMESKKGISPERVAKAAAQMGVDPTELAKSVERISQKFGTPYFKNLFKQYADGTAERSYPNSFIQFRARKPEAVTASENGKRQLLAYLLLADRETLEELVEHFDAVGKKLSEPGKAPLFGSAAKDERAAKYLPFFESAVIAAMG